MKYLKLYLKNVIQVKAVKKSEETMKVVKGKQEEVPKKNSSSASVEAKEMKRDSEM